jgi:hypothetical protein
MQFDLIKIWFLFLCTFPIEIAAQETNALSYFYGKQIGDSVVLNIELRAGNTCNGIGIQRRVADESLDYIGFISGVCGSEDYAAAYVFIDDNPIKNKRLFYRLFLGGLGVSQEIEVFVPDYLSDGYVLAIEPNSNLWAIYFRNPLDVEVELFIYNSSGQQISTMISTSNFFLLPDYLLLRELYFFRIAIRGRETQTFGKFYLN